MSSVYLSRALQAVLQELQGPYSTGQVLASSKGESASLPAGTFGVPSLRGCDLDQSMVMVEPNPATDDHSWPLTTTPTAVTVSSVQGGGHANLAGGTTVRWCAPAQANIAADATVTEAGLTGGSWLDTPGALRQVLCSKDLGSRAQAREFFQAQIGDFPAAVVCWSSTMPANGSAVSGIGGDNLRVRRGVRLYSHQFDILLVTSRLDSDDARRTEGDILRDNAVKLLTDRHSWRGLSISGPQGIQILDARASLVTESAFIDTIKVSCMFALERTPAKRTFQPWNKTHLQMSRSTEDGDEPTVDVLDERE